MDDKIKNAVTTALDFYHDGYEMRNALMKASNLTGISMSEIAKNLPHKKREKKYQPPTQQPTVKRGWMDEWENKTEN